MSIRFAAACPGGNRQVGRVLAFTPPALPANDVEPGFGRDRLLREALRHFAEHGMAAAPRARARAEAAFFAGQREEYLRWMAICRTLDRRMADTARRQLR